MILLSETSETVFRNMFRRKKQIGESPLKGAP
jgi:hypothetical protein